MSSLPGVKHLCVHPPVCMCDIYVPLRKWECAGESGRFDTRRDGRIFGVWLELRCESETVGQKQRGTGACTTPGPIAVLRDRG